MDSRIYYSYGDKKTSVCLYLDELHWLKIKQRIQFKILLLTFKGLRGEAPAYLSDMLNCYVPGRNLRSTNCTDKLVIPKYKLGRYGARSFKVAAPTVWNELPIAESVIAFKKLLKLIFFRYEWKAKTEENPGFVR